MVRTDLHRNGTDKAQPGKQPDDGVTRPAVLLIEDNDADFLLLQRQVRRLLEPRCCERAANRAEVLATLPGDWDLIITDFHLFDIEGDELLAAIAAAQPLTPCIVLSGSATGLETLSAHRNVAQVLVKGDGNALQAALGASLPPRLC